MKQLLLSYLADQRQGDTELCESAREFLLCQGFADEITKLQRAGASDEDQVAALVRYRETCDILKRGASSGLTPGKLAATRCHQKCFSTSIPLQHILIFMVETLTVHTLSAHNRSLHCIPYLKRICP